MAGPSAVAFNLRQRSNIEIMQNFGDTHMQNSAFRTALRLQGERRIGLTCFNLTEDIIVEQYVAFAEEYHLFRIPLPKYVQSIQGETLISKWVCCLLSSCHGCFAKSIRSRLYEKRLPPRFEEKNSLDLRTDRRSISHSLTRRP